MEKCTCAHVRDLISSLANLHMCVVSHMEFSTFAHVRNLTDGAAPTCSCAQSHENGHVPHGFCMVNKAQCCAIKKFQAKTMVDGLLLVEIRFSSCGAHVATHDTFMCCVVFRKNTKRLTNSHAAHVRIHAFQHAHNPTFQHSHLSTPPPSTFQHPHKPATPDLHILTSPHSNIPTLPHPNTLTSHRPTIPPPHISTFIGSNIPTFSHSHTRAIAHPHMSTSQHRHIPTSAQPSIPTVGHPHIPAQPQSNILTTQNANSRTSRYPHYSRFHTFQFSCSPTSKPCRIPAFQHYDMPTSPCSHMSMHTFTHVLRN